MKIKSGETHQEAETAPLYKVHTQLADCSAGPSDHRKQYHALTRMGKAWVRSGILVL